jgi:hypothetical protein
MVRPFDRKTGVILAFTVDGLGVILIITYKFQLDELFFKVAYVTASVNSGKSEIGAGLSREPRLPEKRQYNPP